MSKPYRRNPRKITQKKRDRLTDTLSRLGDLSGIVHNRRTDEVIGGNQRAAVFGAASEIVITERYDEPDEQGTLAHGFIVWRGKKYAYRLVDWDEQTAAEANIAANVGAGDWDWEVFANEWDIAELGDYFNADLLGDLGKDYSNLAEMIGATKEEAGDDDEHDAAAQVDRAEELRMKWGVEPGQLWRLPSRDGKGEHFVLCGDSTKEGDVNRINASPVALMHADPPYGMGKEKDGIANDNLYGEKLDAFQMSWLRASLLSLSDNASVYIWGNAEDLWRLWYKRILTDFPRVTFRNELVWVKESAQGMGSKSRRMYPTATERCIFFMLGEQGFDENADNYWEGWEPIRLYLEQERKKAGWDIPAMKRAAGHSDLSRDHWTGKSQWEFPTKEVYEKLRRAAKNDAFSKDYDELRQELDKTRAYFDNAHANMTDVLSFSRVEGEERHGHATPKPTAMIQRLIKSSCPDNGLVYEPFLGSGTTLIACENLNRYCRAIEISPDYVAVALQRYEDAFGITPQLC